MKFDRIPILSLFVMVCVSASAQNPVTVRMLFGVTATRTERWDGTIEARGGKINSIEPWRFAGSAS